MSNNVEVKSKVTAKAIGLALSALTVNTRGKLAAIGGMVLQYGKDHACESRKDTLEALKTELHLQGVQLDLALCGRALKAHADRKLANEKNVYPEWAKAGTDAQAQEILDKAQGKEAKEKTKKSDLSKVLALIAKLSVSELASVATACEAQLIANAPKAEKAA